MQTNVLIIGGGLAGLALADILQRRGTDFQLLEARARFGGRIKSATIGGNGFDLGPSWFWPGQPRLAALAHRFGLGVFDQWATGRLSYEDETGQIHRDKGFGAMQGSWRLEGGMASLINALVAALPRERLHLGAEVISLDAKTGARLADGRVFQARQIVLALPPRLAANLTFSPGLSQAELGALRAIPTWMGGQAKVLALYERPFWRDAGFSGDAFSRRGPLAEIHDATPNSGGPAALFGFVGVPAPQRQGADAALIAAALQQLGRIFGPQALLPSQTFLTDWAYDRMTASPLDHAALTVHPSYGLPLQLSQLWQGRLHLGSTETAADFGGFLEGALVRAAQIGAIENLSGQSDQGKRAKLTRKEPL